MISKKSKLQSLKTAIYFLSMYLNIDWCPVQSRWISLVAVTT